MPQNSRVPILSANVASGLFDLPVTAPTLKRMERLKRHFNNMHEMCEVALTTAEWEASVRLKGMRPILLGKYRYGRAPFRELPRLHFHQKLEPPALMVENLPMPVLLKAEHLQGILSSHLALVPPNDTTQAEQLLGQTVMRWFTRFALDFIESEHSLKTYNPITRKVIKTNARKAG